jgi:hypothetical protein
MARPYHSLIGTECIRLLNSTTPDLKPSRSIYVCAPFSHCSVLVGLYTQKHATNAQRTYYFRINFESEQAYKFNSCELKEFLLSAHSFKQSLVNSLLSSGAIHRLVWLVVTDVSEEHAVPTFTGQPWIYKLQHVPQKRWYKTTRLHGVTRL